MPDVRYDVDSVSDLRELFLADPSIANASVKLKLDALDEDDLVFVTKEFSGALKITDIKKIESTDTLKLVND